MLDISCPDPCFPRHRAAASLKPLEARRRLAQRLQFSAASGRGLIEAGSARSAATRPLPRFPRHRAAASLKPTVRRALRTLAMGFPRHRAAASLKPEVLERVLDVRVPRFPRHRAAASLKRGRRRGSGFNQLGFPRHRAAASLKQHAEGAGRRADGVFRGIGPRPH